jgi:hypothetical protein
MGAPVTIGLVNPGVPYLDHPGGACRRAKANLGIGYRLGNMLLRW